MKKYKLQFLIFSLLVFCVPKIFSAHTTLSDSTKAKNQFLAYPIAFFLPETSWGFGGAGFYNFRFRDENFDSNPSQVQFTFSITLKNQYIFTIPFEVYRKNNLWKYKGEFSYYKYVYNFYGVGIESKLEDKESFSADYPRFRADILRRHKKLFAGLRIRYDNMQLSEKKENGLLEGSQLTGKDGGTSIGLGLVAQLDTRDYIYNPTKGLFGEAEIFLNDGIFGSDFNYQRFTFDLAKYTSLGKNKVLALQLYTSSIIGDPYFYDLLFFGSPKLMRGYQDRRFKDKNMFILQSEYRFPLYKKLSGVTFLSSGTVGNTYSSIFSNPYKISYGGGLRFTLNQKDRVRLRVDYGSTIGEGGNFYITINDAF